MIAPFIEETLSAIHTALASAALTASQIEEILLVGGATRTPLIRARLLEAFDRPARGEVDPDLCVAMGAAIQAASIAGEKVSAVLVDVDALYVRRQRARHARRQPLSLLFRSHHRQEHADSGAQERGVPNHPRQSEGGRGPHLSGRERGRGGEHQIGEFRVEDLADAPAGNVIIIDLALDRDGILHVSAQEKATGREQRITIDKAMSRYDAGEIAEARQHIDELFGDDAEGEAPAAGAAGSLPSDPKLEALLAKARAKLDSAVAEDRSEIIDLIETIEDGRASGDAAGLAQAVRRLDDLIFYLDT